MTRRNDHDAMRRRSAGPVSSWFSKRSRPAHMVRRGRMADLWLWSRIRVSHAASLVQRWLCGERQPLHLRVGSRCVKGPIREVNEDRCYADQHGGLFVVADGMGGHIGGEQASQTVIEVIASRLGEMLVRGDLFAPVLAEAVRCAILAANQELIEMARVDVGLSGMGATAIVALVRNNQLLLCSVGDSRAYLFRQDQLQQLTVDDTLVQGLVSAGALTIGEAARHPMRHVLLHSVGTHKLEKPLQVASHRLRPATD